MILFCLPERKINSQRGWLNWDHAMSGKQRELCYPTECAEIPKYLRGQAGQKLLLLTWKCWAFLHSARKAEREGERSPWGNGAMEVMGTAPGMGAAPRTGGGTQGRLGQGAAASSCRATVSPSQPAVAEPWRRVLQTFLLYDHSTEQAACFGDTAP